MYSASAFEFYLAVINACSVWVLISNQVLCSIAPLLLLFWEVAVCHCAPLCAQENVFGDG